MHITIEKESVIKELSGLFARLSYVKVAILFGSIARGGRYVHDIDIAVKFAGKVSLQSIHPQRTLLRFGESRKVREARQEPIPKLPLRNLASTLY